MENRKAFVYPPQDVPPPDVRAHNIYRDGQGRQILPTDYFDRPDNLQTRSISVIFSQVIGIASRPFQSSPALRPAFQRLFNDEQCLSRLRGLILNPINTCSQGSPTLFIRGLGPLGITSHTLTLVDRWSRDALLSLLGREPGLSGFALYSRDYYEQSRWPVFGFDPVVADQRMSHLALELLHPPHMEAKRNGKCVAVGRILVHVYPSGYIVLIAAFTVKEGVLDSLPMLRSIVSAIKPYGHGSPPEELNWEWSSRIGNGRLSHLVGAVKARLYESLFVDGSREMNEGEWTTTIKVVTSADIHALAKSLLSQPYRITDSAKMDRKHVEGLGVVLDRGGQIASPHQVISVHSPFRGRFGVRRDFTKIWAIREFVQLRGKVYADVSDHLLDEAQALKDFRLSMRQGPYRIGTYDRSLPIYLLALDRYVRKLPSYYRHIYSEISEQTGFSERRRKTLKVLQNWETELAQARIL